MTKALQWDKMTSFLSPLQMTCFTVEIKTWEKEKEDEEKYKHWWYHRKDILFMLLWLWYIPRYWVIKSSQIFHRQKN